MTFNSFSASKCGSVRALHGYAALLSVCSSARPGWQWILDSSITEWIDWLTEEKSFLVQQWQGKYNIVIFIQLQKRSKTNAKRRETRLKNLQSLRQRRESCINLITFAENLLRICWESAENLLRICWKFAESLLSICWEFAENLLRICWESVENLLRIFCWASTDS